MTAPVVHIVIPVLGRPKRAAAVYESASATTVPHEITFACSPGDKRQIEACDATGAWVFVSDWRPDRADWARKINAVYRDHSDAPWLLLGADDLTFHPGWAEAALEVGERTGAGVVGTNDLSNPRVIAGRHSTHPLVRRSYADDLGTIDGPGQVVAEVYDHQFADDELVATAQRRHKWAFARGAHVEHLHPYFGKGAMDATYRKALRATRADQQLFSERRRLIARST